MANTWTELFKELDHNELREKIKVAFRPMWELNDPAHREEHFRAVEVAGNLINEKLDLKQDPLLIMYMAWFHDLFSWDRETHHIHSTQWFLNTQHELIKSLDSAQRRLVAGACFEHRASWNGKHSTVFSEMMASADRGVPGDVNAMLKRAIDYRLHCGFTEEEALKGATEHLKEKFGTGGYAIYPDIYLRAFGDELKKQQEEIDAL